MFKIQPLSKLVSFRSKWVPATPGTLQAPCRPHLRPSPEAVATLVFTGTQTLLELWFLDAIFCICDFKILSHYDQVDFKCYL